MVAKVRATAILVCLEDFSYEIGDFRYNVNQTIRTYFARLSQLYAARLGQYVRCDYETNSRTANTNSQMKQIAQNLHADGYDLVAFVGTAIIRAAWMSKDDIRDWWQDDGMFCYAKFWKQEWIDAISMGYDPFRATIVTGNVRNLSHELLHGIDLMYTGSSHDHVGYDLVHNFVEYDEHFNIVPYSESVGTFHAERMPPNGTPDWLSWGTDSPI
jgi:hypothetical protein